MKVGKDKYYHFIVCFLITFVTLVLFYLLDDTFIRSIVAGIESSIIAAATKETCDAINPNNKWDWQDIYADIAGIIGGLFFGSILWI